MHAKAIPSKVQALYQVSLSCSVLTPLTVYNRGKPLSLNNSFAAAAKPSKLSPNSCSQGFLGPNDAVKAVSALNVQVITPKPDVEMN